MFRYGLLADIVHLPPGTPGVGERLRDKARHTYVIPGTRRTRVAAETLRDWLALYRSGGFEALYPKGRTDRGQPRRLPPEVAEQLVSLKTEHPALSVNALIKTARERGIDHPLAPSTVHRLLSREGLLDKHPDEPVATDRRRFAFRYAGECWQSDVMHGPTGPRRADSAKDLPHRLPRRCHPGHPLRRLRLLREHHRVPARVQERAHPPRVPHEIVRRQRCQLSLPATRPGVLPKLDVALIHARPYQPAGKGKIERWFRTLRAAWLARLDAKATESLEALNRSLWAWVEGEYHQSPHRGLDGRTPLDQWALAGENVRYPEPTTDLDDLFLFETKRRVMKDRTVSLHGRLYEVDALLVGHTVTLRYDPDAPPSRPIEVVHDGQPSGLATVLDAYANTTVKRHRPSSQLQCDNPPPEPPPSPLAMRKLKENK